MPVPSQPPTSEKAPEKSGGGLYLAGAVILVAAAVALFSWKSCGAPATQQATVVTATVTAPTVEAPVALYAPPPPPKLEEEDAGVDAGKAPVKTSGGASGPAGAGPCGSACTGTATGALTAALRGQANLAHGCYNRALSKNSEISGSLMVSVQIGPSGQVCSASITNDTVHSGEVSSCVLGRYRGQSFPPPSGGCVNVNIPIAFTVKQ